MRSGSETCQQKRAVDFSQQSRGHPFLVDRDARSGQVTRLAETAASIEGPAWPLGTSVAFIRFSNDQGKTYSDDIKVPQWHGFSEVALVRAKNGNIIAACRKIPDWYKGDDDHFAGMGVSISSDDGKTWSKVKMLYTYGRHHAGMVLMPNGWLLTAFGTGYRATKSFPKADRGSYDIAIVRWSYPQP